MKIFASDIDNTLIPQKEKLESGDIKELERFLSRINNLKVAYISGRSLHLILQVMDDYYLPQPDFLVSDVGTAIYVFDNGSWVKSDDYEKYLFSDGYNRQSLEQQLSEIKNLTPQENEAQTDLKLSYYLDIDSERDKSLKKIESTLAKTPAQLIYSEDIVKRVGLVDIIPRKGGKAGALNFLAREVGASKEEVVYSGDSGNDLDALSAGFRGILVGNAPEDLKQKLRKDHPGVYIAQNSFSKGVVEGLNYFLN